MLSDELYARILYEEELYRSKQFNSTSLQCSNDETLARLLDQELNANTNAFDENDKVSLENDLQLASMLQNELQDEDYSNSSHYDIDNRNLASFQYKDCHTQEEKLAWLNGIHGQRILETRPLLKEMYKNGQLQRAINNPHWASRLNEWFAQISNENFNLPKDLKKKDQNRTVWLCKNDNIPLQSIYTQMNIPNDITFPVEAKYNLLIDGYTIIRGVIPLDMIEKTDNTLYHMVTTLYDQQMNDNQHHSHRHDGHENFISAISNDSNVLDLFYKTALYSLVNSILHNETHINRPHYFVHAAQIAYRYPQSIPRMGIFHHNRNQGFHWHLDGMDEGKFSTFALLIGVALSDQLMENSGNLIVFPGSHYHTESYLRCYADEFYRMQAESSDTDNSSYEERLNELRKQKPDLGDVTTHVLALAIITAFH
jgi:hypothetical protein